MFGWIVAIVRCSSRCQPEHRCMSTEPRCMSTEPRCMSTEHRCMSTEHRCMSTEHRCMSTEHRCMSTAMNSPEPCGTGMDHQKPLRGQSVGTLSKVDWAGISKVRQRFHIGHIGLITFGSLPITTQTHTYVNPSSSTVCAEGI